MLDRDPGDARTSIHAIRRLAATAVLATVVLVLGALLMGPASARAAEPETACANPFYELPESPAKDPFYKPPAGFESAAPGTVLKSRCVVVPEPPNRAGDKSYQLLFRSTNTFGKPIAAVTTILVPGTPWAGLGARPLVAFEPAIDGLGANCNPSYLLRQGNEGELAISGPMLERGWEVNIPDFEGQDMQYGAGPIAAHIVLDSIRAAYHFKPAEVAPTNPLGLGGYSGGGQASAWTIEEQHSYAPELHITAGAPGGIPVDLNELAKSDDGTAGFSIVLAAGLGVERGYPELGLRRLLNAEGEAAVKKIEKQCINEFITAYPNKKFSEFTKPEYPEPLALPQVKHVLTADSLGTEPGMANDGLPTSPVFLWQSAADELVPVAGVDRLANYYCSEGIDVTYDRGASGEHIAYVNNASAAIAYLEARFNGQSVEHTCGVNASENTKIDSGPGKTENYSATVTYSAEPNVEGTTFECKLDGGEFANCPSAGVTYTHLAGGQHTIAVRSVTATGNRDVSPATRSWISPTPPQPTVKKLSTRRGPAAGGTAVVVTGINFTGATAVKFDAANATSFKVNSATSISVVSPKGTRGTVNVTVTTWAGTSAINNKDRFRYSR